VGLTHRLCVHGHCCAVVAAVISVASWANDVEGAPLSCTLNIAWAKLGLTAATATITASAIDGFQGNLTVSATKPTLEIPATKGWLLAVHGP
jgi:hypothetical protein